MVRRGQLSIMLILGVVLLILFGMLFALRDILLQGKVNPALAEVSEDIPPSLRFFLIELVEDAVRSAAIEVIAPQSGYQDVSRARTDMDEEARSQVLNEYPRVHPVSYYYLLGEYAIPTLEQVEQGLNSESWLRLNATLNLSAFSQYEIIVLNVSQNVSWLLNVTIAEETVIATLEFPLELRSGNQRVRIPNITVILPLRVKHARDIAECMVDAMVWDDNEPPQAFSACRQPNFSVRSHGISPLSDKGDTFIAVVDDLVGQNTAQPFEFQFLVWRCSGNFRDDADPQRMRVCEYACAQEVPEAVALGICQQESRCAHWVAGPGSAVKGNAAGSGARGIMQLMSPNCGDSMVDGHTMDREDLEDNIECGTHIILSKRQAWDGRRYCCPSTCASPGFCPPLSPRPMNAPQGTHVCCEFPAHRCCTNPGDCCQNGPDDDCDTDYWGNPTETNCCDDGDPVGSACCGPAPPMSSDGRRTIIDRNRLTKDATYGDWDAAMRGYYGWLCADGIYADCVVQNYVETIHGWIKAMDYRDYCHSSRSEPFGFPWGTDYIGKRTPYGCCASPSSFCASQRLT